MSYLAKIQALLRDLDTFYERQLKVQTEDVAVGNILERQETLHDIQQGFDVGMLELMVCTPMAAGMFREKEESEPAPSTPTPPEVYEAWGEPKHQLTEEDFNKKHREEDSCLTQSAEL